MSKGRRRCTRFLAGVVAVGSAGFIVLTSGKPDPGPTGGLVLTDERPGAQTLPCEGTLDRPEPSRLQAHQPLTGLLVGTNYSHHHTRRCSLGDTGIVDTYNCPRVRDRVRSQLEAMRKSGLRSLRIILWHEQEPGAVDWGVVPSTDAGLVPQAIQNLTAFVADVRDAGYARMTVSFGPTGENNPRSSRFEPGLFEQNWSVVAQVRAALYRYGPPSVQLDLLNEGAVGPPQPAQVRDRVSRYVERLYDRYGLQFGTTDVTVSAIASLGANGNRARLARLLDTLEDSGQPMPEHFEIHLGYEGESASTTLAAVDALLRDRGLDQPLVIGEAAYDEPAVAAAIAAFLERSSREITEILQWPLTAARPCNDVSETPPYSADAYLRLMGEDVAGDP